jgi:multidrug resistance efflux pump
MMTKIIRSKLAWTGLALGFAILGGYYFFGGKQGSMQDSPLFTVQKGTLQINVLQGGEIRALKNYEVKSEIELPTKILSLINEGYRITEKDVKEGKVLVELDSADIRDKVTTHEIEFQTTVANLIDADEQRGIQISDNQSLARESEQNMRYTLMDFERYMGKEVAQAVLKSRGIPNNLEALEEFTGKINAEKRRPTSMPGSEPKQGADPLAEKEEKEENDADAIAKRITESGARTSAPSVDFLTFLVNDKLGDGEAEQKLRQLENEALLHQSELSVAKQNVEASERLASKQFITKTTLENDHVNLEKTNLTVLSASTQLDLFKKYEFPKQAEQFLSAYEEALKKLQRTLRSNRARMAQVESKYQTARRRYEVELERKNSLETQVNACIIKAQEPGLVAYGAKDASAFKTEQIEEGATVRFRQSILTIPNMDEMGVHVNIHESQVKKVRVGQPCRITVDAEPGKTLDGVVAELAVLPDSASSRYTPNLKVYPANVQITGTHEWLKPGMNAKVEIIINQLDDILYVPVQSIEVENDNFFAYIRNGSKLERREIKTGGFNDEFIEIKGGLAMGDQVSLALPKHSSLEAPEIPSPKKKKSPEAPKKGLAVNAAKKVTE